jgi:hypothetical protein
MSGPKTGGGKARAKAKAKARTKQEVDHSVKVWMNLDSNSEDEKRIIQLARKYRFVYDGWDMARSAVPNDGGQRKLYFYPAAARPR